MKIRETLTKKPSTLMTDVKVGDVFWSQKAGLCLFTTLGSINLSDFKLRSTKEDDEVDILEVELHTQPYGILH